MGGPPPRFAPRKTYLLAALVFMSMGLLALLTLISVGGGTAYRLPSTLPDTPPRFDEGTISALEAAVVLTYLPPDLPEGVLKAGKETVIVIGLKPGEGFHNGTGFAIRPGFIVTAAHILNGIDAEQVRVICSDAGLVNGKILAMSVTRDIAFIEAEGCGKAELELDSSKLKVNDKLHMVGFTFEQGGISAFRYHAFSSPIPGATIEGIEDIDGQAQQLAQRVRELNLPPHVAVTGARIPGNSGSPVLRDDGKVIGMLVITDIPHNRSFIVPARSIRQMLKKEGLL